MIIIWLFFQATFAIFFLFLCLAFVTGAPFVPSAKKTAEMMIKLSGITQKKTIYDLGSGDGRLLFLARKAGGHRIIGLEINPMLVVFTKLRIFFSGAKNMDVYWSNFWTTPLSDADIIFVYLLPWKMEQLAIKLKSELKPGATIVSNSFIFPDLHLSKKDEENHVYVFTV